MFEVLLEHCGYCRLGNGTRKLMSEFLGTLGIPQGDEHEALRQEATPECAPACTNRGKVLNVEAGPEYTRPCRSRSKVLNVEAVPEGATKSANREKVLNVEADPEFITSCDRGRGNGGNLDVLRQGALRAPSLRSRTLASVHCSIPNCIARFSEQKALQLHLREAHKDVSKEVIVEGTTIATRVVDLKEFRCHLCVRSYKTKGWLKRHLELAHEVKELELKELEDIADLKKTTNRIPLSGTVFGS